MSRRSGLIWFLLLAPLFLLVNRSAYSGFFQGDEIENVNWTRLVDKTSYLEGLLTPRFNPNNFRPVGHFFFRETSLHFGITFWKYVTLLHLFHLFNVWLIWLLTRRMGAPPLAAGAGCLLFAFHMALFDTLWKPMYVFDLLCATFCLLSLLLYSQRRWVLSFAAFWFAYKAKELAVMLPLALACYELWFGKRNWKPLVPFFLASLSFGLQGLLLNPNQDNDYTFRFTPLALAKTSLFYASQPVLAPYAGFLLPLGALAAANRRTWFGLAMMGLLFVPLLFLPGRLFSAYCYVPFTGLAIAFSGLAETGGRIPLAIFFAAFLPLDAQSLAAQRAVTLHNDEEVHQWFAAVERFAWTRPVFDAAVCNPPPTGYDQVNSESAIRYIFRKQDLNAYYAGNPEAPKALQGKRVAILTWDKQARKLDVAVEPGS